MTTHEEVRSRLDDYVDGALPDDERLEVARHLEGCPSCAEDVEALRSLLGRARELPAEVAPERDLWAGIEARISGLGDEGAGGTAEPAPWLRRILQPRWALAGALAAAVLVTAVLLRPPTGPGGVRPAVTAALPSDTVVPSLIRALESQCAGAGKQLASMDAGPAGEDMAAVLGENVQHLDTAISETKDALEVSPDDPALLRRLTSHYQRKLSLLHEAIRLAQEA